VAKSTLVEFLPISSDSRAANRAARLPFARQSSWTRLFIHIAGFGEPPGMSPALDRHPFERKNFIKITLIAPTSASFETQSICGHRFAISPS
jgi:hypothetical protein